MSLGCKLAVGLFFVLGVTGCAPKYVVIRQSVPSALSALRTYTVEADFSHVVVLGGSEASHLAGKDAAWVQGWQNDKLNLHHQMVSHLQREGGGAAFSQEPRGTAQGHITVRYTYIDPGSAGWHTRASRVTARVIFFVRGAVTDEIEVSGAGYPNSFSGASSRMARAGGAVGVWAGRYIKHTTAAGP